MYTPRRKRPLRSLLLTTVIASVGPALAAAQNPLPPVEEYHARVFTVTDGLPASNVIAIAQDGDGYLYVGGGRGVSRFDGYRFSAVPLDGFSTTWIHWLLPARGGGVWVVSRNWEVGFIEETETHVLPLPEGRVYGISRTSDGRVWIGTSAALLELDSVGANDYTVHRPGEILPSDTVIGVLEPPGGPKFLLMRHRLLRIVRSPEGRVRFDPVPMRLRARYSQLHNGMAVMDSVVWVALEDGVLVWDDGAWQHHATNPVPADVRDAIAPLDIRNAKGWLVETIGLLEGLPKEPARFTDFALAADGTAWTAVNSVVEELIGHLFRQRDGIWEQRPFEEGKAPVVNRLLADHEGSVWVATKMGVVQLAPRRVAALSSGQHLAEEFTTAVLQTRDGSVWVGTWGRGLHHFRDQRLAARYSSDTGFFTRQIRSLYESEDGLLWVGGRQGLAVIDERSRAWLPPGIEEVRGFTETLEPNGTRRLWIAGERHVLTCECSRTVLRSIPTGGDLPLKRYRPDIDWGRELWAIHAARSGAVWVGGTDGLFRIADGKVRRFGSDDGLRSRFVASIHEEPDGTLWFGTYAHGLHRYRGGRLVPVTTNEGLHHNGVWRMLPDERGGIWMSSDGGIFRVDHARLHAVADAVAAGRAPAELLDPLVFTEAEGTPSPESNRASPAGWRLNDGTLVFNNIGGLVVIDPVRATRTLPSPRTVLRGVSVDGHPLPLHPDQAPRLHVGARHLEFSFAALSYAAPEQNRYRYRMDGFDEDWVQAGTEHRTSYTGLRPGRYTFRVQGAPGMGPWSDAETASYAFVVPAAFWQSWWFRIAVIAVVLGLLFAAYRFRVSRLLEMQRLRLRIASDLHDDVGSNLSSIALMSEMLRGRTHGSGLDRQQLERIGSAAGETITALREIVWLVDPKHDNLHDLIQRMRATAADMLDGTDTHFATPEPFQERSLDPVFVRHTFLIYKEAVHNIAKHAAASRVSIEVREEVGDLVLVIEDDGVGFQQAAGSVGHGLSSMHRRASELDAKLRIQSVEGRGTRITFRARMA